MTSLIQEAIKKEIKRVKSEKNYISQLAYLCVHALQENIGDCSTIETEDGLIEMQVDFLKLIEANSILKCSNFNKMLRNNQEEFFQKLKEILSNKENMCSHCINIFLLSESKRVFDTTISNIHSLKIVYYLRQTKL